MDAHNVVQENKMGTKPIFPLLISMALPPVTSMFIQFSYNLVDSMFVARISEEALTAVSLAFPIQNLILSTAIGAGVGCNALIARKLGEKNYDEANSVVTHSLLLSTVLYLIFVGLGLFFIEPFFNLFTNSQEIFSLGCTYTQIITFLSFGWFIHIAIQKIIQATGNMIYPMIFQIIGALLNCILDPILIFGLLGVPKLGVKGAAIATATGQIISMTLGFYVLIFLKNEVKIKTKGFLFRFSIIKDMFILGFPSLIMNVLGSVLVMFINGILTAFGSLSIAMFGVYFKLQTLLFMTVNGLIQGAMPIMSYNFGAKNRQRLLGTLKASLIISGTMMLFGTFLFSVFPTQALLLFDASDEMLSIGRTTLRVISSSYIFAACGFMFASFFQATGRVAYSLLISLLRQVILLLPVAYVLSKPMGLLGIWISFPVAEIATTVIAIMIFRKLEGTTLFSFK